MVIKCHLPVLNHLVQLSSSLLYIFYRFVRPTQFLHWPCVEIYLNDDGNACLNFDGTNSCSGAPMQSVNTTVGGLMYGFYNNLGANDYTYTRVLTSAIDTIARKVGNGNVHGRLLEVKIARFVNVEIPLTFD
jgi:hypothetical protein